jgi:transposase
MFAHQQKHLPENIVWKKLPTACPELNPAERVFEELRKFLANRVFENKEEIEVCLTYWIKDFQQKPEQLIKLTKFHWM